MPGADHSPDVSDFQLRRLLLRLDRVIPSDPTLLDDAVGDITAELDATACWCGHEPDVETIGLAVREAIANAIVHGNVWCWSMNKGCW